MFPGSGDLVDEGFSAIDERATFRMDLCTRFLCSPRKADLFVIADVVDIIGPSALGPITAWLTSYLYDI